MPRIHTGPITNLREAAQAWRYVWVFCLACGHAGHAHPHQMAERSQTISFREAALKCRCDRCRSKDAVIFPSRRRIPFGIKN